ncbi:MAG: hypothetical protein LBK47_04045, partial [Prevotellaceae bacterium]|nr:hypothetical protein [Prevotellaceae bacterium]
DAYTKFYQWNRADKPWPATGAITGAWEASITDPEWTTTPCPEGWRLPTREEYVELDGLGGDLAGNKGGKWVAASEKGNEKPGRYYGPSFATCKLDSAMVGCVFFPASGYRSVSVGALTNQGIRGYNWTSMQMTGTESYRIYFYATVSGPTATGLKANGFSVRCVQ